MARRIEKGCQQASVSGRPDYRRAIKKASTGDACSRLAIIRRQIRVVIVRKLDVEFIPHLYYAGDVSSQRMQQLPLVERRDNAGKRHHAPPGQHIQLRTAGKLPLLNEQRDPLLQVAISRRGR
jgi:hypothetical protein